jgi:prevent-host-death family protein
VKTVTIVEFRNSMETTLRRVAQGESVVLTRRGRAVARLEPVVEHEVGLDDPIYSLGALAVDGESLSNEQIERELYGS